MSSHEQSWSIIIICVLFAYKYLWRILSCVAPGVTSRVDSRDELSGWRCDRLARVWLHRGGRSVFRSLDCSFLTLLWVRWWEWMEWGDTVYSTISQIRFGLKKYFRGMFAAIAMVCQSATTFTNPWTSTPDCTERALNASSDEEWGAWIVLPNRKGCSSVKAFKLCWRSPDPSLAPKRKGLKNSGWLLEV